VSTALAPILQYFFTEHLVSHKQVSPRTIVAYRDSFRLLLQFLKKRTGKRPFTLCVDDLVKFDSTTYLQLHGKGRKERVVPL
jgi:site-specific recombinase XerD